MHIFQKNTGGHIQFNCIVELTISAGKNPNRSMDIPQQYKLFLKMLRVSLSK